MSHIGVVLIRNDKAINNTINSTILFKAFACVFLMCLLFIFSSSLCYADDASQFSIYLSTNKNDIDLLATEDIDKIKLGDKPVVTMDDVISYSKRRHVLEISREAYDRFMKAGTGTVFVVCVGKERIYAGAIWSKLMSQSCPGIAVLNLPTFNDKSGAIRFELGYPSEKYFEGKDKRSDPRIIHALKEAGKLNFWF